MSKYTAEQVIELANEYLDSRYGRINVAGFIYLTSEILSKVDPIEYRHVVLGYGAKLLTEGLITEEVYDEL